MVMDSIYSCPGDPENDSQASLSPRGMILFSHTFELWKKVEASTSWWWPSSLRISRENQHEESLLVTDKGIVPGDRTEGKAEQLSREKQPEFWPLHSPKNIYIANVSAQRSTHKIRTKESHKNTWQYSMRHPTKRVLFCLLCLSVCRVSEYRGTGVYG